MWRSDSGLHKEEGGFKLYHSITFGDKNTWDDWRLVPASRPLFNPPAQKVKTLDIPGGDGVIDLSQALTGYPVYQNRTGSIEFIVINDFKPWHMAYSDIMDYLHGQTMRAILEDDPEYFYEGRFTVNAWKSEKDWSRLVIDYDVGPYKWKNLSSIDNWLWDPFNFQNGVIQAALFRNIAVTTEMKEIELDAVMYGRAPVCPRFIVQSSEGRGVHVRFVNRQLSIDLTKLCRREPFRSLSLFCLVTTAERSIFGSTRERGPCPLISDKGGCKRCILFMPMASASTMMPSRWTT